MVILGRLVLIGIFILAVYLPLRGWHSWGGCWRYLALLPVLPLVGLVTYVLSFVFSENADEVLSPELVVLIVLGSLVSSAVLGLLHNRNKD